MLENRRPKIGVATIVIKNGKVLLGQRINAHGSHTWSFPGGHLEWNESWEECACREAMEEAGITLSKVRFAWVTNDRMTADNKHYITIFMKAECTDEPRVCEPDKMIGWSWHDWDNLPRPHFDPIINLINDGYHPFK
ncbi:MAG: NUDIX hydrolase [Patescibacteria group bacterium]